MIIALLMLPILIGFAALAVEGGLWYSDRHDLRAMADAGAIAAAWARAEGEDEATAATEAAERLGFNDDIDAIEIASPPGQGAYAGDGDAIEVVITRTRPLALSTLFLDASEIDISMRAVAVGGPGGIGDACLMALNSSAQGAVSITGSVDIDMTGCGVQVNSTHNRAVRITGSGSLTADYLNTPGDTSVVGSAYIETAETLTGDDGYAVDDPYAAIDPAIPAGCDHTGYSKTGSGGAAPAPGTYCDGFSLTGSFALDLSPGVYYIKGGSLKLTGSTILKGTGVTFVLSDGASVSITGSSYVDISAPTTGETAGMVFFSRVAGVSNKFTGSSDMKVRGAMYFGNSSVTLTGSSDVATDCMRLVADTVTITGSTNLANGACSSYGLPSATGGPPSLVE